MSTTSQRPQSPFALSSALKTQRRRNEITPKLQERVTNTRSLPNGWRWAKMSDVCSRVQDGTHFSPKHQTPSCDFKYITAKNIKHWGLDLSNVTYVSERIHREIYRRCNVEKGDVLYI